MYCTVEDWSYYRHILGKFFRPPQVRSRKSRVQCLQSDKHYFSNYKMPFLPPYIFLSSGSPVGMIEVIKNADWFFYYFNFLEWQGYCSSLWALVIKRSGFFTDFYPTRTNGFTGFLSFRGKNWCFIGKTAIFAWKIQIFVGFLSLGGNFAWVFQTLLSLEKSLSLDPLELNKNRGKSLSSISLHALE